MLGIVLVSSQLPVTPLVFRRELDLSGDSVVRQRPLGVVSLPLAIVRRVVVVTHPHGRHSRARQVVVFRVQLWSAIAQVPVTNFIRTAQQIRQSHVPDRHGFIQMLLGEFHQNLQISHQKIGQWTLGLLVTAVHRRLYWAILNYNGVRRPARHTLLLWQDASTQEHMHSLHSLPSDSVCSLFIAKFTPNVITKHLSGDERCEWVVAA